MTDEERASAVLESMRQRDELRRDICILNKKLREAGESMLKLGRALEKEPASVKRSVRDHTFELPNGTSVKINSGELGRAVADLSDAHKKLVAADSVLEPRLGVT